MKGKIKKILIFGGILLIIVVISVIAGFYLSGVMGKIRKLARGFRM